MNKIDWRRAINYFLLKDFLKGFKKVPSLLAISTTKELFLVFLIFFLKNKFEYSFADLEVSVTQT